MMISACGLSLCVFGISNIWAWTSKTLRMFSVQVEARRKIDTGSTSDAYYCILNHSLNGPQEWPFIISHVGLVSELYLTLGGCAAFRKYNKAIMPTMAQLYSWQHLLAGGKSQLGCQPAFFQSPCGLSAKIHSHIADGWIPRVEIQPLGVTLEEAQAWTLYIFICAAFYWSNRLIYPKRERFNMNKSSRGKR